MLSHLDTANPVLVQEGEDVELVLIAWENIPERLQNIYNSREPIFVTRNNIILFWLDPFGMVWRIFIKKGFISDRASIPWPARIIGIGRSNRTNWMDLGSLPHDAVYRGAGSFCDNRSMNRFLADRLMLDLWVYRAGRKTLPRVKYSVQRAFGGFVFRPDPTAHSDDVVQITSYGMIRG